MEEKIERCELQKKPRRYWTRFLWWPVYYAIPPVKANQAYTKASYLRKLEKDRRSKKVRALNPNERQAINARRRARYRKDRSQVLKRNREYYKSMSDEQKEKRRQSRKTTYERTPEHLAAVKHRLQRFTRGIRFDFARTDELELEQSQDWYNQWFESLDTGEAVW